jgi:hypothetical protein
MHSVQEEFFGDGFKVSRLGVRNETCIECADRKKKYNEKRKEKISDGAKARWRESDLCIHDMNRVYCITCKTPTKQMCLHGLEEKYCRRCGAGAFCMHDIVRGSCDAFMCC